MHFDSSGLNDYYFIDSQWLCDIFAHAVSSEFNCKYTINQGNLLRLFRSGYSFLTVEAFML